MTKYILASSRLSSNAVGGQSDDRSDKSQKKYLSILTAQRMIKRFLTCDRLIMREVRQKKFTAQELADKLSMNLSELKLLVRSISRASCRKTPERIAMSLIKLYCSTKLVED